MARRRLDVLDELPILDITAEVSSLAEELIRIGPIPRKAAIDAVHIAVSVFYRMDYLLTWNCRHLANAAMRPKIEKVCRSLGYAAPAVICTPEELMEG